MIVLHHGMVCTQAADGDAEEENADAENTDKEGESSQQQRVLVAHVLWFASIAMETTLGRADDPRRVGEPAGDTREVHGQV